MEIIKLSNKMKAIPLKEPDSRWVLCACPECESEFIAKLETSNKSNPDDLFGLKPLPEELTCPYCGIQNDIYAQGFPKVEP